MTTGYAILIYPKSFHFSGNYELPFGHGQKYMSNSKKVAEAVLGGWSTNWILTLQDGQPGTIPCAISTTSGFGCNALLVPGQSVTAGPHNVNQLAQSGSLCQSTRGDHHWAIRLFCLGGAPTQYYGPGYHRLDFSLFKNFNFTEKIYLQFRAEFFNLTNTPNFSLPGFSGNGVVGGPRRSDYTSPANFGKITSTRDGQNDQREIQFALKLYF